VLSVTPDESIDSVRFAMSTEFVSGVPVCDKAGVVVGVLSKSDLVDAHRRYALPNCLRASVGDLMTERVYAVHADDPVWDAMWLMVTRRVHRVIATDDDGRLIGIVTPMDVMSALLRGARLDPVARSSASDSAQIRSETP